MVDRRTERTVWPTLPEGRADLRLARTRHGPLLVHAHDTGVSDTLLALGEFAGTEIDCYRSLLSAGDVFVDVGANIGAVSAALQRTVPGLSILAFEPQPALHALAVANTMGLPGCSVFPYALGAEDGVISIPELNMAARGNYGGVSIDLATPRRLPAPIVRLDRFVSARAAAPRLVKIDVEGMEGDVLRGAEGLFHPRLVLSIEADRRDRVMAWLPALLERATACYLVFFRHVSAGNDTAPKDHPKRRIVMPHMLAFLGEVDAGFEATNASARILAPAGYERAMR
jgi:FkbM family methyltransferase